MLKRIILLFLCGIQFGLTGCLGGGSIVIKTPLNHALFPADIRAPKFMWVDSRLPIRLWKLAILSKNGAPIHTAEAYEENWTPSEEIWNHIKKSSGGASLTFKVEMDGRSASIDFDISKDEVAAPIFYRLVPSHLLNEDEHPKVKWMLGWLDSYKKPFTLMTNQVRCFNCHTSSMDGKTFGFEYNPTEKIGDKGGYLFFENPGKTVHFNKSNFFDWNSFLPGEKKENIQAFQSSISPDGRYIATGGNARVGVALTHGVDYVAFQLHTQSQLQVFSKETKSATLLPGADDLGYVNCLPTTWSADGKYIYFSRIKKTEQLESWNTSPMHDGNHAELRLVPYKELDKKFPYKLDLVRIPFNEGKGGVVEEIQGASKNGMSNYFPKASPDGKWIAYTASPNGVHLFRSDSKVFIVPTAGGKARELKANGENGNSWHSWSPNGKWLAFASRSFGLTKHTEIMLTHIDENGNDSVPVMLTQFREEDYSVNLPEFYNIKRGQLEEIIPELE